MFIAYAVVAVVLSAALVGSAFAKFTRNQQIVADLTGMGVRLDWFTWLGSLEVAGAAGLLVGLGVPALGAAAAVGLILYFIGAVITHVRAGATAPQAMGPAVAILLGSIAALVLRLGSA